MAVKKAIILTADKFEDMELFFPYFRLLEEGVEVHVAGPAKGQISGEYGYGFEIGLTFDQVDPAKYDLLILPGGSPDGAPTTVRKNPDAQRIAKAFAATGKPIAAICHGPYTLISAGLVKGKKMTSFWGDGVPEELKKAGASYVDAEVVVDGNWVTSRYPGDLPAFMREVMKLVRGKPVAKKKKA
ncbi:MAG: type 1 glutamine amidotransferase domain-containing protein [Candidatus Micrarchaeia archaeon]